MGREKDSQFSCKEILDGYFSRAGIDLVLPNVFSYSSDYINGLGINPKAKSGYLTSKLVNSRRRISTTLVKPVAKKYIEDIMDYRGSEYVFDKSLIEIGGREKRISIKEGVTKELKTRCIFQMEDIPTLISQSFAKPINESLQKINDGFNYGGRINGGRNYIKYLDDMRCDPGQINFNCDFTGHDNNVQENAIIAAMAMLRLCYREGEDIDRAFIYLTSSIIYKRVVLPESGLIYEITKGVATGHGFTSIITTMCSYGTLSTAINLAAPHEVKRTLLRMAGDDVTGKIPLYIISAVDSIIAKRSGHIMDSLDVSCGIFESMNRHMRCTFLKKKYQPFSWNDAELYSNLINPTMKEKGFGKILDNLQIMITQAPFDLRLNNILLIMICLKIIISTDNRTKSIRSPTRGHKDDLNRDRFLHYVLHHMSEPLHPLSFIDNIDIKNLYLYNTKVGMYLEYDIKAMIKAHMWKICGE